MADGELFDKIEKMVENEDMTIKQAVRLLLSANVEIYRKYDGLKKSIESEFERQRLARQKLFEDHSAETEKKIKLHDERIEELEKNEKVNLAKDEMNTKRFMAKYGAIGLLGGAAISGLVQLIIEFYAH